MKIPFTKMHGLGNDFILVDTRTAALPDAAGFARTYCERRFGVGADQVLLAAKPRHRDADIRMVIFNADGGEVEMCGNGVRAFAHFVWELGVWDGQGSLAVETAGGIVRPRVLPSGEVEVDMGTPVFPGTPNETVQLAGGTRQITRVEVGNPHCVLFVDDLSQVRVDVLGPAIEADRMFPLGTNVEFVWVHAPDHLVVKVWERGAGQTLACGSGACAALVAAAETGRAASKAAVELPGGTLTVEWREDGTILQTGPAIEVFEGELMWPLGSGE